MILGGTETNILLHGKLFQILKKKWLLHAIRGVKFLTIISVIEFKMHR